MFRALVHVIKSNSEDSEEYPRLGHYIYKDSIMGSHVVESATEVLARVIATWNDGHIQPPTPDAFSTDDVGSDQ